MKTGQFPFFDFARQFDVWQCTPLDQGGRLVQLELIGSETDADIVKAVRDPKFFAPWGNPIQWNVLESTRIETSCWLNRWYVLPSFARLFYVEKDRRYLDDLLRLLRAWARDNPPPTDTNAYFKTKKYTWRDMQVAWRTRNLAWCYFLGAEGFTEVERAELYGMISDNARVLHDYFGAEPMNRNNHQSHAASSMLYAGVLFPDLAIAKVLIEDAMRVLEHHIEFAFYPDGNSVELAPGYYPFITSIFRDALMICRANAVDLPKGIETRLNQCRDYLRVVQQPDGLMPPVNDSSQTVTTTLLKTLDMQLPLKPLNIGSHYFESSGQAVMRDKDQYLFADAGPLILFHWHGGKMGFHLQSGGGPFIVDSGECNYERPNRVNWYCTPQAHNTLLIDGDGDYDRAKLKMDGRMSADCHIIDWQSTPAFDSLTMIHNGFAVRADINWVRAICLIKDGFTLVVDQVFGPEPHDISLPFHFAPGDLQMADDRTCVWHGSHCTGELICADHSMLSRKQSSGLVSQGSRDVDSPIVTFSAHSREIHSAFLLATYPNAARPSLSLEQTIRNGQIEIQAGRGTLSATLRLPAFTSAIIAKNNSTIDVAVTVEHAAR